MSYGRVAVTCQSPHKELNGLTNCEHADPCRTSSEVEDSRRVRTIVNPASSDRCNLIVSDGCRWRTLTIPAKRPKVESMPLAEPRYIEGNASGVYAYKRAAYKLWNQYLESQLNFDRAVTHSMALKPMLAARLLTSWNRIRETPIRAAASTMLHFLPTRGISIMAPASRVAVIPGKSECQHKSFSPSSTYRCKCRRGTSRRRSERCLHLAHAG